MKAVALLLALVAGCASRAAPGPTAIVRLVAPEQWTTDDVEHIRIGLAGWVTLGFRPSPDADTDLAPCPADWHLHRPPVVDCALVIGIKRETGMHDALGVDGLSDRASRTISVDARWTGWLLSAVVAHETGHILMNTSRHLPAGQRGVMQAAGAEWDVSDADRRLGCETIRRGCDASHQPRN